MYVVKPSLEHIAVVKVTTTLWNQDDVKNLLTKFDIPSNYRELNKNWLKIEDIAAKKVAKLPLTEQMKDRILCFIRPIGFEILKWRHFHKRVCNLHVDLPNEFCWTPPGSIDLKKTAEAIIKDQNIDITTRYKMACMYCLKDDILKLWKEMPESHRKSFYNQKGPMYVKQIELVILWTYQIKDDGDKMIRMIERRMGRRCSPCRYGFEVAAREGNRVATEYFLKRLKAGGREEHLVTAALSAAGRHSKFLNVCRKENNSQILCLLFSELNAEQQMIVFKQYPRQFLTCFLDWPNQVFFMETSTLWNFLDKYNFGKLLLNIVRKAKNGYKDFNYQNLFQEFWEQSPHDNKRHVVSVHSGILLPIVSDLFKTRDVASIRLIFQDASPEEKKYLIYDDWGLICQNLMNHQNQLSLLKYFIKECLPTEGEVIEFKHALNKDMVEVGHFNNKSKLCGVLDEVICEFKKRKGEEGESSKKKREYRAIAPDCSCNGGVKFNDM